jgi:hypothetical protein
MLYAVDADADDPGPLLLIIPPTVDYTRSPMA